jgi:hypothetical protein
VRYAIIGAILLVAGAAAIAFGVLSGADAYALWQRTWPILLFVVAITVVTELAADAVSVWPVGATGADGCCGCWSCCSLRSAQSFFRSTRPRFC